MKDSIKLTPKEDGSFDIEWDESNPKHSYLNRLTEDQLSTIIERHLEFYLSQTDNQ